MNDERKQEIAKNAKEYADNEFPSGDFVDYNCTGSCQKEDCCFNYQWQKAYFLYLEHPKETSLLLHQDISPFRYEIQPDHLV